MGETRSTVALVSCPDYRRGTVERALSEALDLLGGMARFVHPGMDVFLKANLLSARPPDDAVTTHPEVVRAVARAALDAGGKVAVGDSSGLGSIAAVAEKAGIAAVARDLGIPVEDLTDAVDTERPKGAKFRKLQIARRIIEADAVINLPKVKTHQQMMLTLAVKNLFGCIVGREKIMWHMSAGRDAALFARALVEICLASRPMLNIADGVVGMEGSGPAHGMPRAFGFLAAGSDPFALDAVLTRVLGVRPEDMPVLAAADAARADGLPVGVTDLHRIDVVGSSIDALHVEHLKLPVTARVMFIPDFLARFVRRFVTVRPRVVPSLCRGCSVCVNACPAQAMTIIDRRVRINDTLCIRCFCCQELCPHGAVQARRGLFARFFSGPGK